MPGPAASPGMHDATAKRAAAFFEQRRFGLWSDADQAELDAWFAESVLHRVAYLRLEGAAAHTGRLAALRPPERRWRAATSILRWPVMLPLLAAASVALFAMLAMPFVNSLLQPPDRTYSTNVGGRTLLKFADGTVVDLDTDTSVRFRMTGEERKVWLEKGKAWFRVAHNAANPFTVIVGRHRVTDLGTEFLVRRGADDMEVALFNGRASLSTEGAAVAMLTPGEDAIATAASTSIIRRTPRELADELAWRRGVLVFRNTPLAQVVREFNRYNATKLVIADPSIADVKIYAELRTDDYEDLLQLAQTMLKLRIDREGGEILISRAAKNPKRAAP